MPCEEHIIKKIKIRNVATFGQTPVELDELREVNFIYGANGTGNTTISRIIADAEADDHSDCEVIWKNRIGLETLVYNRDFVDRNVNQPNQLQGIFTLGEKDKQLEDKIADANGELKLIIGSIETFETTLHGDGINGGKISELKQLEKQFAEECWKLKNDHDSEFRDAFTGYRGSKIDFKGKLLTESANNTALVSLETLRQKAKTIFSETPQDQEILRCPNWRRLSEHESNPILEKVVIEKSDVNISGLIEKLGNSDWVKQGRKYYDTQNRVCPFCQQETEASLEKSLNEYFDEAFEADSAAIESLFTEPSVFCLWVGVRHA